jgi:hypothetical protein
MVGRDHLFQGIHLAMSAINRVPKLEKLADENDEMFFHVTFLPEPISDKQGSRGNARSAFSNGSC